MKQRSGFSMIAVAAAAAFTLVSAGVAQAASTAKKAELATHEVNIADNTWAELINTESFKTAGQNATLDASAGTLQAKDAQAAPIQAKNLFNNGTGEAGTMMVQTGIDKAGADVNVLAMNADKGQVNTVAVLIEKVVHDVQTGGAAQAYNTTVKFT